MQERCHTKAILVLAVRHNALLSSRPYIERRAWRSIETASFVFGLGRISHSASAKVLSVSSFLKRPSSLRIEGFQAFGAPAFPCCAFRGPPPIFQRAASLLAAPLSSDSIE
jgi:hypothetical protein